MSLGAQSTKKCKRNAKFVLANDSDISIEEQNSSEPQTSTATTSVEIKETQTKYSFDFLTNLLSVAEAYRSQIRGNKIEGYIQRISMYPSLQISLFTEKQFEAIHKTPINNRILHFDATGSLVCVPQQNTKNLFNDGYRRILNYFLLLINYEQQKIVEQSTTVKFKLSDRPF